MTSVATASRINAALTVLRVVVGGIVAAHGAQKLFVYGLDGVTRAFTHMGVPLPGLVGPRWPSWSSSGGSRSWPGS
jgi:putative oxidoreductase